MTSNKSKSSRSKAQARAKRIRAANEKVAAKARALTASGVLKGGTVKKVQASVRSGVKGLSASDRYERRVVNKLYKALGGFILDEKLKPLPKERRSKIRTVSPEIAEKLEKQNYTIVKSRGKIYVPIEQQQTIRKSGDVVTKRKSYESRAIPMGEDMLEPDENGETPLFKAIKRKFAEQKRLKNPQHLGFIFGANKEKNINKTLEFATAQEMYEHLTGEFRYGDENEILPLVDGLIVLSYPKMIRMKIDNKLLSRGRKIGGGKKRSGKNIRRADMTDKQRENARMRERIRYAIKKKGKPNAG